MLAALLVGACGVPAWFRSVDNPTDHRPAQAVAATSPTNTVAGGTNDPRPSTRTAPPVRIVIPAISVKADVESLHRAPDGTLNTPVEWNDAGWYADGIVPGDQGPAVIVGHVDTDGGAKPAVFYDLPKIQPGNEVLIETGAGDTRRFIVDTIRQVAKVGFPTDLVYGPTPLPELRLITCTGAFDDTTGNYLDNLVVTAYSA